MATPLIFEIKGNALDDGPGIRTVVFFKGCPLSCVWCHNPEGMRRGPQIAFEASQCVGCDDCIACCPEGALDRGLAGFVDRDRCTLCGECTDVCPGGGLSLVGQSLLVEQIVDQVRRDIPFFAASGGGVTLSGGEPTLFYEFAGDLARRLKELSVHVLLETCGLYDPDAFDTHLLSHLDQVYFDIKIMDGARHRALTGVDNRVILSNFQHLVDHANRGGPAVLPRVPLIPGLTTTDENLRAIAAFLQSLHVRDVALLPYHPLWKGKLTKLGGKPVDLIEGATFDKLMAHDEIERSRSFFHAFSIIG